MSFGIMAENWLKMEEGISLGIWKTGPWVGFKISGSDDYAWIGAAIGNSFQQL